MTEYSLELLIDSQDLIVIRTAQLRITLAQSGGNSVPIVVWQSFDPFENNLVTWNDRYGMFASTTAPVNGARLYKVSTIDPVVDAAYYTFTPNAVFTGPTTGSSAPPAGNFKVENQMPSSQNPSLTFGLMQSATINTVVASPRAVNAAVLLAGFSAQFMPSTTIMIWLQANLVSETTLTYMSSNYTTVDFATGSGSQVVKFDNTTGTFAPYSKNTTSILKESSTIRQVRKLIF